MKIRQLLFIVVAGLYAICSHAGQVWHYQTVSENHAVAGNLQSNDKNWGLIEYRGDPYPEQLLKLKTLQGYAKLSVVIPRGPAPALENAFLETTKALRARGIELQYKFFDGFPTPPEAQILQKLCNAGAQVFYINNAIPTEYESEQLKPLGECLRLEFALGRYPRYVDVADFKRLQGLHLAFLNDYFPAYAHMDNLNLINTPIALRVARSLPDDYQVSILNLIGKLTSLTFDLDLYPDQNQYALFAKLKRSAERVFAIRWANLTIRDEDIAAFKMLNPERLQIKQQLVEDKARFAAIRNLPSEIVIEYGTR